jgi:hypothetical protein
MLTGVVLWYLHVPPPMVSLNNGEQTPQLIRTGPVVGPVPEKERLYLLGRVDIGLDACSHRHLS